MKKEYNELKEICSECKHTKRFHNSVHKEGSCSQPTCQCTCFIESGLYYGMDIFDAYEHCKEDILKLIDEWIAKLEHCRDTCESQELDTLEELKSKINGEKEQEQ